MFIPSATALWNENDGDDDDGDDGDDGDDDYHGDYGIGVAMAMMTSSHKSDNQSVHYGHGHINHSSIYQNVLIIF